MSLKIKDGVDLNELRKFGFALGHELIEMGETFEEVLDGCEYMKDWWIKFKMDPDSPEEIEMTEDGNPVCEAWVDTRYGHNHLWFDASPNCTYHVSMNELDIVTDTVFELAMAGLIEKR